MEDIHRLYRVVYVPETNGWRVRAANGAFASATHESRDETIDYAKMLAAGHGWARLIVHNLDGTVEHDFVWGEDLREHPAPGGEVREVQRPSWL